MLEKVKIALAIIETNPGCKISGSLALSLQEIKTKRSINDIDIYVPAGFKFIPIEGMKEHSNQNDEEHQTEAGEENEFERVRFTFCGQDIDVFYHSRGNALLHSNGHCVRFDEIIKFKVNYALSDSKSKRKHSDDLIYIFQNN